jgi:hypothetical protein
MKKKTNGKNLTKIQKNITLSGRLVNENVGYRTFGGVL